MRLMVYNEASDTEIRSSGGRPALQSDARDERPRVQDAYLIEHAREALRRRRGALTCGRMRYEAPTRSRSKSVAQLGLYIHEADEPTLDDLLQAPPHGRHHENPLPRLRRTVRRRRRSQVGRFLLAVRLDHALPSRCRQVQQRAVRRGARRSPAPAATRHERTETMMEAPVKLCECGCGRPAPIAKWTNSRYGHVKDQPTRFIRGHAGGGGMPENRLDNADEWFWPRVDRSGGPDACWPWTGTLNKQGYGQVAVGGGTRRAHRIAFRLTHGEPDGIVCHDTQNGCATKACCNPCHLYDGTSKSNTEDRRAAGVSTSRPGEGNHQARLTDRDVADIRDSIERSSVLAARYGVSRGLIWLVRTRRAWKHLHP